MKRQELIVKLSVEVKGREIEGSTWWMASPWPCDFPVKRPFGFTLAASGKWTCEHSPTDQGGYWNHLRHLPQFYIVFVDVSGIKNPKNIYMYISLLPVDSRESSNMWRTGGVCQGKRPTFSQCSNSYPGHPSGVYPGCHSELHRPRMLIHES